MNFSFMNGIIIKYLTTVNSLFPFNTHQLTEKKPTRLLIVNCF